MLEKILKLGQNWSGKKFNFFIKMHNALSGGPTTIALGRIFIIHHRQQKVNRQIAQKIKFWFSRNCAFFFEKKVLTFVADGGILSPEVKRGAPKGSKKIFEKIKKNLLTNFARHDIIDPEVKGKQFLKRRKWQSRKFQKKTSKNLLTSQAKSAIMKAQWTLKSQYRSSISNFWKFEKKFKKPLDKLPKVWYNKTTKGQGQS